MLECALTGRAQAIVRATDVDPDSVGVGQTLATTSLKRAALARQMPRKGALMRVSDDASLQNSMAMVHEANHTARWSGKGSAGSNVRGGTSPPGSGAYLIGSMS